MGPEPIFIDQLIIQNKSSDCISFLEWVICEMRSELILMGLDTHCLYTSLFKPVAHTSLQEAPIGRTVTTNGGYS